MQSSPRADSCNTNGGSSTLTITTSRLTAMNSAPRNGSPCVALLLAPFGFVMIGGVERKRARWFALALMLLVILADVGCGRGGGGATAPTTTTTSHPATTSTVTITATSAGVAHSTSVSITVQ